MKSECILRSDSDSSLPDLHKLPVGDLNQPKRVQKDYKDALEALIHMPTMGLKWSNTVAMHNAICYLSGALQTEGEEKPASKEDDDSFHSNSLKMATVQSEEPPPLLVDKALEPSKIEYMVTGPYTYPPVAINIAPKGYRYQSNAQINEKEQMRKASHNIIERRRREKINELTQTLAALVPACQQRDGLHPTRSACSKVIILEKTITYLRQVTAENDKLKKSVDNTEKTSSAVALQAMQNQIAILEKENELLRKKVNFLPGDSSSMNDTVTEESEKSVVAISTTELAELKALEMIRKLLDSVQKRYGQGGRLQEVPKELSTKIKTMHHHTCTRSDSDQSCISFSSNDMSDKHNTQVKRKQIKADISIKKIKTEYSGVCEHVPTDLMKDKDDVYFTESKESNVFSTDVSVL